MTEQKVVRAEDVEVPEDMAEACWNSGGSLIYWDELKEKDRVAQRKNLARVLAHIANNPPVPNNEQCEALLKAYANDDSVFSWGKFYGPEWMRMAWLKKEPEYPEAVRHLAAIENWDVEQAMKFYRLGQQNPEVKP